MNIPWMDLFVYKKLWRHLGSAKSASNSRIFLCLVTLELWLPDKHQFCCIFVVTKDKFGYFLKKLFHSSISHTYHHNSSLFLNRHKNIRASQLDILRGQSILYKRRLIFRNVYEVFCFSGRSYENWNLCFPAETAQTSELTSQCS